MVRNTLVLSRSQYLFPKRKEHVAPAAGGPAGGAGAASFAHEGFGFRDAISVNSAA